MEDIIKKSIEGGYDYKGGEITLKTFCLDPLFWQSLGKACGWSTYACSWDSENPICRKWCSSGHRKTWLWNALCFHEINLTQSWDKAVEYLQSII